MSEQKKVEKHTEHQTIKPGKSKTDEISEKDLDKASGGYRPSRKGDGTTEQYF